tara:strand:+ start:23 stop:613 length:591 start_codon:yes stop_codon:yes gene_type:complete
MLEFISEFDESLFHAINGVWPAGDTLMWLTSNPKAWIPLYIILIIAIAIKYSQWSHRFLILLSVIVCIGLNDTLSSHIVKPATQRLRPSHRVEFEESIHLYKQNDGSFYKGGKYSFFSGHASNFMGIAVLFGSLLCGGVAGCRWILGLVFWALLIGYSRIHLGVHFPGDVLCGWIVGAIIGGGIFKIVNPRLHFKT